MNQQNQGNRGGQGGQNQGGQNQGGDQPPAGATSVPYWWVGENVGLWPPSRQTGRRSFPHGVHLPHLPAGRDRMPVKKSELYGAIWASCDKLRGGMDASQYKDYVLVPLFVKYVSDRYAGDPHATFNVPPGGS